MEAPWVRPQHRALLVRRIELEHHQDRFAVSSAGPADWGLAPGTGSGDPNSSSPPAREEL